MGLPGLRAWCLALGECSAFCVCISECFVCVYKWMFCFACIWVSECFAFCMRMSKWIFSILCVCVCVYCICTNLLHVSWNLPVGLVFCVCSGSKLAGGNTVCSLVPWCRYVMYCSYSTIKTRYKLCNVQTYAPTGQSSRLTFMLITLCHICTIVSAVCAWALCCLTLTPKCHQ